MTPLRDCILLAVNGIRSPQPNHRLWLRIDPEENDVARRIAIGKRQTDDFAIEAVGDACVCDREMRFVEMHGGSASNDQLLSSLAVNRRQ